MSERIHRRSAMVAGPAGDLQVVLETLDQPVGVAVICHPHPLYQGTMNNKVVHTLARVWIRLGCAAIRFNFRGVGKSAGEYDAGQGEGLDALAIIEWARRQQSGPLFLCGFSFGAMIAYGAAQQVQLAGLVTVAPAVDRIRAAGPSPECPWLIVHGDQDELVPIETVTGWLATLDRVPQLAVLESAEHFFHGRLIELRDVVSQFAEPLLSNEARRDSA
ncbi:MAG: alpha/beta family hydrolase [Gammaproteobacteria bacterium]